jgi:hypothetical protein
MKCCADFLKWDFPNPKRFIFGIGIDIRDWVGIASNFHAERTSYWVK